ncbi:site-specific integrase [Alicyclobacillus ferrooxydans]|uniref:Integrase n=1 Tax=Alicyclobacillus ferrooxydans TaxID=471514 RepID=A0A0P9GSI7_9BACL|nr:site-specific integrase [Alicyclobacillus ferrooxydans]KPV44017.1 integrase [Alicyclobacillus ferrooxydans]
MESVQPIREREDIEVMKQYLRGTNLRDYCLFILGLNSGLRISDLLHLTIKDVVDETGAIKDRVSLKEQKTGKSKHFPLSRKTKDAISEYLSYRSGRSGWNLDDPLFKSRKGNGAITRQQAWRALNAAARYAGIMERIGTHTLRKTFGYQAYKSGVDITRIQKLLNHSTPFVTLAYIGITQDELDKVYLELNL